MSIAGSRFYGGTVHSLVANVVVATGFGTCVGGLGGGIFVSMREMVALVVTPKFQSTITTNK